MECVRHKVRLEQKHARGDKSHGYWGDDTNMSALMTQNGCVDAMC